MCVCVRACIVSYTYQSGSHSESETEEQASTSGKDRLSEQPAWWDEDDDVIRSVRCIQFEGCMQGHTIIKFINSSLFLSQCGYDGENSPQETQTRR